MASWSTSGNIKTPVRRQFRTEVTYNRQVIRAPLNPWNGGPAATQIGRNFEEREEQLNRRDNQVMCPLPDARRFTELIQVDGGIT